MKSGLEEALHVVTRALMVRHAAQALADLAPMCGPGCCDALLGVTHRMADEAAVEDPAAARHILDHGRALERAFYDHFRPDPVLDADECDLDGLPSRGWWLGEAKLGADLDRRLIALGFAEAMVASGDFEG